MKLITPQTQPNRTLRAGDVVVFNYGGEPFLMISSDGDKLMAVGFNGSCSIDKSAPEWLKFWDERSIRDPYTIYSADEWALKLVRKEAP